MKKGILILGAFAVAVPAQALVIDDFTTGEFSNLLATSWVSSQTGDMAGGERDVLAEILLGTSLVEVAGGSLKLQNDNQSITHVTLDYDGAGDEPDMQPPLEAGPGLGLDLTAGGLDRFTLEFLFTSEQFPVTIQAITYGQGGGDDQISSASFVAPANGGGPVVIEVPYEDFTGNANFASIDRLLFEFSPGEGHGFALGSLSASPVPEPGTFLALAAGLGLLLGRRRHS